MSRYFISGRARLELKAIWEYIAKDNVRAADKIKVELRAEMEKIARAPGIGHVHAAVKDARLRFRTVHPYLIAYLPNTKPVRIVRVVHGARDVTKLFRRN